MAIRPVIDIEINDAAFKRFQELFKEYSEELEKQPGLWREVSDAAAEGAGKMAEGSITAKEALAVAAAQAGLIAEALEKAIKAQHGLGSETGSTAKHMSTLQKATQGVGAAISSIGGWIVKLGAFGGLGAILSGFGVADLASAAFTRYRAAGQLGISPGALASFQVNAQQFLTDSALTAAAQQQLTYQSVPWLQILGLNGQRAMSESPLDLTFQEYRAAAVGYRNRGRIPFYQTRAGIAANALGLDPNAIRNISLHLSDFDAAVVATNRDMGALGFSGAVGREWTTLQVKLALAGNVIETALIKGLAPLAPQIAILAEDIAGFISSFVNQKDFGILINDVSEGLHEFGLWLRGPEPKELWANLKLLGQEIGVIAQKFAWLLPHQTAPVSHDLNITNPGHQIFDWLFGLPAWVNKIERLGANIGGTVGRWVNNPLDMTMFGPGHQILTSFASTTQGIQAGTARLLAFAKAWGLSDTLAGILPMWTGHAAHPELAQRYISGVESESGVSRNTPLSKLSVGQLANVVAAISHWEGTDEVTRQQVLAALSPAFRKPPTEATSISAVDADIRKYGKNWFSHLPKDVAGFLAHAHLTPQQRTSTDTQAINKTLKAIFKRPQRPIHVAITNTTASRVAVSANAAAVS